MIFSREILQKASTPQAFERGQRYHQAGYVDKLVKHGEVFIGEMRGSAYYRQVIDLRGEKFSATCTCPYDHPGICKHIIAVGLSVIEGNFEGEERDFSEELANQVDLVSINELRNKIADQKLSIPELKEQHLSLFLASGNHRNTIRVILGAYEGLQKQFLPNATNHPTIHQETRNILEIFSQSLDDIPPQPRQGKDVLEQIFIRWDKYEQSLNLNFPGKSIRYHLGLFEDLMLKLAKHPVSAHFLRMKIEGYGIHDDSITRLKNFLG